MELSLFDLAAFAGAIGFVVVFSMYKSRSGGATGEDYFLAGRGLTWPLIGLSIVAANLSTEQFVGMAGQGAGNVGLAVGNWQLTGAVGVVVVMPVMATTWVCHVPGHDPEGRPRLVWGWSTWPMPPLATELMPAL